MTISSSLNASVAGLSAQATRLATIADNIANSATAGYRRAETDFHAMVIGSQQGTYTAGGVRATTQRLIDQGGAVLGTDNPTDLAVRGRGFIAVTTTAALNAGEPQQNIRLITTGGFRADAQGYLTSPAGHVLLGWPAAADGSIPTQPRDSMSGLVPVRIPNSQFAGEPTTRMEIAINLPATATETGAPGTAEEISLEYFDNLGRPEAVIARFIPTVPPPGTSNRWTLELRDSASGGALVASLALVFDDTRTGGGRLLSATPAAPATYDPATGAVGFTVDGGPMELRIGPPGGASGLTQLSDSFAPIAIEKNGAQAGNFRSVEVDQNGYVNVTYDNGATRRLYQIPLVDVPNPNGLAALDGQAYALTRNSGSFFLWDAGSGSRGEILGNARQESATDVAGELTGLIQTQRAYSSNAKVIQTVDEMLQETTNMKR